MCLDRKLEISFVYPVSGHKLQPVTGRTMILYSFPGMWNAFLSGCNILIDDKYIYNMHVLNYIVTPPAVKHPK